MRNSILNYLKPYLPKTHRQADSAALEFGHTKKKKKEKEKPNCMYLCMAGQMMQVWFGSFLFANNTTLIFFINIITIFLNNIKKFIINEIINNSIIFYIIC